jgi:hypothetical protein
MVCADFKRRKKQGKPFTLMATNSLPHREAGAGEAESRTGKARKIREGSYPSLFAYWDQ